jgi:hypothetical protein
VQHLKQVSIAKRRVAAASSSEHKLLVARPLIADGSLPFWDEHLAACTGSCLQSLG